MERERRAPTLSPVDKEVEDGEGDEDDEDEDDADANEVGELRLRPSGDLERARWSRGIFRALSDWPLRTPPLFNIVRLASAAACIRENELSVRNINIHPSIYIYIYIEGRDIKRDTKSQDQRNSNPIYTTKKSCQK